LVDDKNCCGREHKVEPNHQSVNCHLRTESPRVLFAWGEEFGGNGGVISRAASGAGGRSRTRLILSSCLRSDAASYFHTQGMCDCSTARTFRRHASGSNSGRSWTTLQQAAQMQSARSQGMMKCRTSHSGLIAVRLEFLTFAQSRRNLLHARSTRTPPLPQFRVLSEICENARSCGRSSIRPSRRGCRRGGSQRRIAVISQALGSGELTIRR